MKIRTRITIVLIPLLVIASILINATFGTFFQHYLEEQEKSQIERIKNSVSTYMAEKESKYLGSVNDWAHWDDTYFYLDGSNPEYAEDNLPKETYENLDISFAILQDSRGAYPYRYAYDAEKDAFVEIGGDFLEDFERAADAVRTGDDLSGIFRLGGHMYIVAASDVTDSAMQREPNGKLVFGRRVDAGLLRDLENATGCWVDAVDVPDCGDGPVAADGQSMDAGGRTVSFHCVIPNRYAEHCAAMITLTMQRDLFLSGMQQFDRFVLASVLTMAAILAIVLILLGIYATKPLIRLSKDVKSIDLTDDTIQTIAAGGKDEIGFLRNAVNNMLEQIGKHRKKIRDSEEKLYATLSSVGDGVIAVDRDCLVQFLNPVAQQLTGWTQEEAMGRPVDIVFDIINEYTRDKVENPAVQVFETEEIVELANHTLLVAKDGTEKPIEDTAAPIRDKTGAVVGCVLVFRDFSEKKEKQRRIEYLSYHDQLTGLYNRRFFEEELKRLDKKRNLPISLAYADVNGLKTINDAFGHEVGDHLIQSVANLLQANCRADDIIARTGGDEFILILPKTDSTATENLTARIRERIETQKIRDINLSVSFGWDTKTESGQSVWDVLRNAENFMYKKKILDNASKRSNVIKAILKTLKIKSPREDVHSKRVSLLCEAIGKAYGLGDDEINELRMAGELHDIGKIAVDESILNKPDRLTESEWAQIKSHPEIGYRVLSTSNEFYSIAEYVLAHHEKWDGTGYPKGLKGAAINWKSRVIAIADAYDAMTYGRPYRKALSEKEAIEEIRRSAGTHFDPEIARVFVEKVLGAEWEEEAVTE